MADSGGFRHFNLKRFALKRRLAVGKVSCAPQCCVVGITLTLELKIPGLSVASQGSDLETGSRTRVKTAIGWNQHVAVRWELPGIHAQHAALV